MEENIEFIKSKYASLLTRYEEKDRRVNQLEYEIAILRSKLTNISTILKEY